MALFKDRNLRVGTIILLLSYLAMGGALFAVSLFLQTVLQLNAFDTGLTTLPLTIGLLIFAILAPSMTAKLSHKKVMAIGCIMAIIGCLMLSYQFTLNTTMWTLLPGLLVLGAGLGFIMALCTDVSLMNIPAESQNNASGINSTGTSLGESMGTAIIGIILILGVIGGVGTAVDTYAPDHSGDEQFHMDLFNYLQKAGTADNLKDNSTFVDVVNLIIQETMAFVMQITAIIMGVVFLLTLRLQDRKIKQ
jgi:Na+/melibiose symporter-like transporter